MICELAPAMTLYPSVAHLQLYQEPYEVSLFQNTDYYVRKEIESLMYDRQNSFYPHAQNLRGAAHPLMIAAATRRLTDLYRREQAREIELQAKRRFWQLQNIFSEIDANLCERRRHYRDGTFVEYGHSLYEPTFVPLVERRYVNDPIHGVKYMSPRSRVSGKEKRTDGQKKHQNRLQTKVECEPKQLKSAEKVNEQNAEHDLKSERNPEGAKTAEHQQKASTYLESSAPQQNSLNSAENLESEQISDHTLPESAQSIQQRDTTEKTKTTDIESTQNNKTKNEDGSRHKSKTCSSIQKEAISNSTSSDISRCPSIEEVEDEEFKDWKTRKGNRL